ncbi:AraC family transcriptional regulator [Winogradskyella sp.]|jgi:AraC-like DNA-binding protein|uniref:helix-turn-helix domain-containing protein n=1 Tax=Winogradskyella sp. TaxID=1883156 RepID=UPI0025F65B22|nr:helix-turn-helix domain-containing protein [Winogradskyella sp.]MCT4630111.1 helix-turn-helix domain-containing protein [Winogradskyella sp.]
MTPSLALIIFSSVAVTSCGFLASYFLFIKKEHRLKDLTLGFLFIAIAFRIAKSIFYYSLPEISPLGIGLGFFGFACIGPLALTYFKINQADFTKLKPINLLHLIVPIIGFAIIIINSNHAYDLYLLANISLAAYLGLIANQFVFKPKTAGLSKWHKVLFYSLVAISAILIYQLLGATMTNYAIGIALASLVMYFLFFYALQSPEIIKKSNPKTLPKPLLKKIKTTIEDDKIYMQPAITLAQLSEAIDTPTYLVSKATKTIYNKSFPEVINSFRINAIKQKLSQPEFANEKIENLAYDVGFNTASTFYNAFKKETNMSPREYQKTIQERPLSN